MATFNNQEIKDTYERVLQIDGGVIQDGLGQTVNASITSLTGSFQGDLTGTASYATFAISASHETIKEISSSYADTASYAQSGDGIFSGSFSGSYVGDGSSLTGISSTPFPFAGDAQITGSLIVSGSFIPHGKATDDSNVIMGKDAAPNITSTSGKNVLIGNEAGGTGTLTAANGNVCIGYQAGYEIDGGDDNVCIGNQAGYLLDGPTGTIAIGTQVMRDAANNYGVGIGMHAGRMQQNNPNVFIGGLCAATVTGVSRYNVVVGYAAAYKINDGYYNTILGDRSGYNINDGYGNVFIGHQAGSDVTDGDGNIIIGSGSLGVATMDNQLRIGNGDSLITISASLSTGDVIFASTASATYFSGDGSNLTKLQRPITTVGTNPFTSSAANAGEYFRMGGNVTCSIILNATASCPIGAEFEFFQTSSAGAVFFETGSSDITLNSKSGNVKLTGQFSGATLKKVGTDEWDLIGDLG